MCIDGLQRLVLLLAIAAVSVTAVQQTQMQGKARADQPAVLATERTTSHLDGTALDETFGSKPAVSEQRLVAAQKAVGQSSAVLFDQVAEAFVALKQKSGEVAAEDADEAAAEKEQKKLGTDQDVADEVAAQKETGQAVGDKAPAAVVPPSRTGLHYDSVADKLAVSVPAAGAVAALHQAAAPVMVALSGAGDVILHKEKHTGGATHLVRASQQETTTLAFSHSIALTSSGTIEGTDMLVQSAPVPLAHAAKVVKFQPHPVLAQPQLPPLAAAAPAAPAVPFAALVPGSGFQPSVAWHVLNLHGSSLYVTGLIFATVVAGLAAYCIDMRTCVDPQSHKLNLKGLSGGARLALSRSYSKSFFDRSQAMSATGGSSYVPVD